LASFHLRAPVAVSASAQSAARTPGILLAAIEMPVPVQQQTIPTSARPEATASPTARPIWAHAVEPSAIAPKRSICAPRRSSSATRRSSSGPRSSAPIATRTR